MRARWLSLHARLERTLHSPFLLASWGDLRSSHPALAAWSSPAALVAHLTTKGGDLGEKDRILAALVLIVQGRGPRGDLALAIVWLGLWPALDATFRRWIRAYARDPDELCSAISFHFTSLVRSADLAKIRRVAGTLARSTRREVAEEWRRQRLALSRTAELSDEDLRAEAPAAEPPGSVPDWLEDAVGAQDAGLLVRVTALGETQHEAGARIGLSPDAARRRFQRAIARARRALSTDSSRRVSHSRGLDRISPLNRSGPSTRERAPRG